MATITLRSVKGSALTFQEGDANFTNLNNDKVELTDLSVGDANPASGSGSIAYNNTTGVFTYTPPDLSSYLTSYTETDPIVGAVNGLVKADGDGNISAAVAGTDYSTFDGAYSSLTGAPTNVSSFTNDAGYLTSYTTELSEDTSPVLSAELVCGGNVVSDPTLKDYKETIHSLGSTDSPTITIANGNVQSVTITSGLSLPAFADAAAGQSVTLIVSGSGTASGTAAYKFAGGATDLTNDSVVSIFYDGTTYWASIATDFQ